MQPDAPGPPDPLIPQRRESDFQPAFYSPLLRLGTVLIYGIRGGWSVQILSGWLLVIIIAILWLSVEERLGLFLWLTPLVLAWAISIILVVSIVIMSVLTVARIRAPKMPAHLEDGT